MKIFDNFKRKSLGENILHCIVSAIFMVVALSYIYILVWTFVSGLKTHDEIIMNPFSLPAKWLWENYIEVFRKLEVGGVSFLGMTFNSIWFSVLSVLIQQLVTASFAYCVTKYKFPGSNLIYPFILIMITLPIYGNSGATYKIYKSLGLIDSYAHVILAASGFNTFFLYYSAFFKNLSWTYAEAAMVDGASHHQIWWKVMMPQAKPIMGALFITSWMTSWNSYEGALIMYPNLPTLPVGIYQFNTEMIYRARLDILFAACFIICIPALILFVAFNKTITTSVSVGGIKG